MPFNTDPIYESTTESGITIAVHKKQSEERQVLDVFSGQIIIPNSYIIVVSSDTGLTFFTTFHNSDKFEDLDQIISSNYVVQQSDKNNQSCVVCESSTQTYRVTCVEGEPLQHICHSCLSDTLTEIQQIPAHELVIPEL